MFDKREKRKPCVVQKKSNFKQSKGLPLKAEYPISRGCVLKNATGSLSLAGFVFLWETNGPKFQSFRQLYGSVQDSLPPAQDSGRNNEQRTGPHSVLAAATASIAFVLISHQPHGCLCFRTQADGLLAGVGRLGCWHNAVTRS